MGAHRALGTPGGARRVEDGGVVLRIDGDVGRRGVLVHLSERERERPLGDGSSAVGRLGDGERGLRCGAVLVGDDQCAEVVRPPRKDLILVARSVSTNATLAPESSRP